MNPHQLFANIGHQLVPLAWVTWDTTCTSSKLGYQVAQKWLSKFSHQVALPALFPKLATSLGDTYFHIALGQISRNVSITDATFCVALLEQVNIRLKRILGSLCVYFDHQNIFDKLNIFLRYCHIKMCQWWNAEFHHFCALNWRYLKNSLACQIYFVGKNLVKVCSWSVQ